MMTKRTMRTQTQPQQASLRHVPMCQRVTYIYNIYSAFGNVYEETLLSSVSYSDNEFSDAEKFLDVKFANLS